MGDFRNLNPARLPPGKHGVGNGLWIVVAETGARTWSFRFRNSNGRDRQMGLGGFPTVSLEQAQEAAIDAKRLVRSDLDPIEHRKVKRRDNSFRVIAEAHIAVRRNSWNSPNSERAWRSSLEMYVYPTLGDRDVSTITAVDMLTILRPLWASKRPTAERLRVRIEATLAHAAGLGLRAGENPASWNVLRPLLPTTKRRRPAPHAALPYRELPAFMRRLAAIDSPTARALAFTILTAARTNETISAKWREFDLDKRVWTLPAHRMKNKIEHDVPLSAPVVEILRSLPRGDADAYVFANKECARLGVHCLRRLAQQLAPGISTHGFRATFRDWLQEETTHDPEACEKALAHVLPAEMYRRGSMFEKRRRLMEDWGAYCEARETPTRAVTAAYQATVDRHTVSTA